MRTSWIEEMLEHLQYIYIYNYNTYIYIYIYGYIWIYIYILNYNQKLDCTPILGVIHHEGFAMCVSNSGAISS